LNVTQDNYLGDKNRNGKNYCLYDTIANNNNKMVYDSLPSGDDFNIIMNSKGMQDGNDGEDGLSIEALDNFHGESTDPYYNAGNVNGVDLLAAKTNNAIHKTSCTFTNTTGTHTTDGINISKSGEFIRRIDDPEIKDKLNVIVKAYVDKPDFYDEKTPNPKFDKNAYDSEKYDPNNQPYQLKPAGKIFKTFKDQGKSDAEALKEMFYDHKNGNTPAMHFAKVNLYDNDSFDFNVPEDQIEVAIDDASGQLTTKLYKAGADHTTDGPIDSYTVGGFETSTDPYVPDGKKVKPSMVGIIVGCSVGGVLLVAIV
jgi:hypothetical protein